MQRNELVRFQTDDIVRYNNIPNNQHQQKNGYKFTINDRSAFYDWYNAYFEIQFQLQLSADGAAINAQRATVINGSHSFINHLMIKSAGEIIYDTDNLHKVTFVKNLLEYSDDYSRSVGKSSFWYLDTSGNNVIVPADPGYNSGFHTRQQLTRQDADGDPNNVNVIIPLNRYGFFEELQNKMLPSMQLQFNIELQDDNELVYRTGGADCRVVVNRFLLWVPKLTPKDSMFTNFINNFLKEDRWKYLRELYQVSSPNRDVTGYFQISPSIDNVKAVFVYLQNAPNAVPQLDNPYIFNTFKLNTAGTSYLSTCRLEYGNGIFYPETEYDTESKVRIFNDVMSYADRRNDYNTGTQLNTHNYNSIYPLIFFDLSFQTEKVTRDPKQLIFRYKLSRDPGANITVNAVVLYHEEVVIDKVGNELVIV